MIRMERRGNEITTKVEEIQRLRLSDEVSLALYAESIDEGLDDELLRLRTLYREGKRLKEEGITRESLDAAMNLLTEDDF